MPEESEGLGSPPPYKMIQTIGLSVGAAVAYIIAVLGLMFYCKKRCKAKRLQKQPEGEEPEMECLNGEEPPGGGTQCHVQVPSALWWPLEDAGSTELGFALVPAARAKLPTPAGSLELAHSQGLGF